MKRLLVKLLLLAIISPSNTFNDDCCSKQQLVSHRQLLENVTNNNNTNTSNVDGSVNSTKNDIEELPSCNDVLLHETTSERCNHAQNCDGEYLMVKLLPLAFCNDPTSPSPLDNHHPILIILFPVLFPMSLLILTLLLFRLLGSTAENYFSPALEMISSEFHIPPQLAGVTLLALGNGAPDVSAVVNAIKMNSSEGIPLSLGELTGGGMFVQSVVVGRIVFLGSSLHSGRSNNSDEVLGVSCRGELIRDISMYAISAGYVYWLCTRGAIFYHHVIAMLLLYCGYVLIVLWAEVRRYYSNPVLENNIQEENIRVDRNDGDGNEVKGEEEDQLLLLDTITNGTPSYDEEDQSLELSPRHRQGSPKNQKSRDPPGVKAATRVLRLMQKQKLRQQQRLLEKRKSLLVDNGEYSRGLPYQFAHLEEDTDNRTWSVQLFRDSICELGRHFYKALISDILVNSELSRFEWWCMILESPFIILRKLVVPIPCEDEYNRSLVAYSIMFSPVWIGFYLSTKMEDFDPFCISGLDEEGYCFPSIFWPSCISLVIGCAVIKYAPATQLPLHFSLPIAIYGFLIAATWIDVISDQLVNVLEFIGVVLRIPSTVMGMTILAWGNSVGDYTTNGALAAKGLSDMSMAACFAGPSFNLLVGLGFGLLTQKEMLLSKDGLPISLMPSVQTGFVFLICNCAITVFSGLCHQGVIPKTYGYMFWAMYLAYMTLSAQHLVM